MTFEDAVVDAINRIKTRRCTSRFSRADFDGEIDAIVKQSGSKAAKPMQSVSAVLQRLRDEGLIVFHGKGDYEIVGAGSLNKPAAGAKKAGAAKKRAAGGKRKASASSSSSSSGAKRVVVRKAQKTSSKSSGKVSRKQKTGQFNTYIGRLLKKVSGSKTSLSRDALRPLVAIVNETLSNIAQLSSDVLLKAQKKTLGPRDVQVAVRLLFPGELAKHAVNEGQKAIVQYKKSDVGKKTERAGLEFSVPRVETFLRSVMPKTRISEDAPVYAAAVIQYLLEEILELSVNAARDNKRMRIIPRHLVLVIKNDEELNKLFSHIDIAQGGVIPNIHSPLLPKRKD